LFDRPVHRRKRLAAVHGLHLRGGGANLSAASLGNNRRAGGARRERHGVALTWAESERPRADRRKGRQGLRAHTRTPPSAALIIVASGLAALPRERHLGGQR